MGTISCGEARFWALHIVSQPLSPASAYQTQHLAVNLYRPLYLVLCVYYIYLSPISCISLSIILIIGTIYCGFSASSAPHPFAPTLSCVHGCLYYYILWRYYILYLLFLLLLYLVNSPTSPLRPSTPTYCTTVIQPQNAAERGSQLATHVYPRDLRSLTV